jgi:hypothetical protein
MASLLWRSGLFVACGLLASPALFLGCREILSFEEREFDPSLADGGADADAADPLSCEAYCARIQEKCTAAPQYPSLDACLGVCLTFPVGSLDDTTGHTLGCRVHVLEATTTLETADCAAAGPSGDGACGTKCESYCTAMERICPDVFSGVADCLETCTPLLDCGLYTSPAGTPDDPSIQCRFYHLSVAAEGLPEDEDATPTTAQGKHCPHASGTTECISPGDGMCPPP